MQHHHPRLTASAHLTELGRRSWQAARRGVQWGIDRGEAALAVTACLAPVVLVGLSVARQQTFGYRDAGHYYPPLLSETHRQWTEGLPLWNAWEERGRPLWADPTASVLYPGQVIFRLGLPPTVAFEGYVLMHVLLASVTMFVAAWRLGASVPAASLASLAYAGSGPILFQTCNPPYLISAAWLPLCIWSAYQLLVAPSRATLATLAIVLAMLVVGGDPQAAYLLGWAAALGLALLVRRLAACLGLRYGWAIAWRHGAALALAGILGAGLSAAQWIPTYAWSRHSERVIRQTEALPLSTASESQSSGTRPRDSNADDQRSRAAATPADHESQRYAFSIGPWRWLELFWPNAGGKLFPTPRRWMRAIPAEGHCWTPSLYMGILPGLLAFRAWKFRGGGLAECWLSWIALLGIVASLGVYGVGWLVGEIVHACGASIDSSWGPVGGLYWLLVQTAPGFGLFRYPAKIWTWVAASLSLLVAFRLDEQLQRQRPIIPWRMIRVYLLLSVACLVGLEIGTESCRAWLARVPPDRLFGPLDIDGVHIAWRQSLTSAIGVALLIATLVRVRKQLSIPLSAALFVLMTIVDLALAHYDLVPTVDEVVLGSQPTVAAPVDTADRSVERPMVWRWSVAGWYPEHWRESFSPDRLTSCIRWDRMTSRAKYPLVTGLQTLESSTSFSSRDQRALVHLLRELERTSPRQLRRLLAILGVDYVVMPASLPSATRAAFGHALPWASVQSEFPDVQWRQLEDSLPFCWSVRDGKATAPWPGDGASLDALVARLRQELMPSGKLRDVRHEVVLAVASSSQPPDLKNHIGDMFASQNEAAPFDSTCRVIEWTTDHVRITVRQNQAGFVVINQNFDEGWQATLHRANDARAVNLYRANGVMQAVAVPAGEWELNLLYRPLSVCWGTRISTGCLMLLLGVCWRRAPGYGNDRDLAGSPAQVALAVGPHREPDRLS